MIFHEVKTRQQANKGYCKKEEDRLQRQIDKDTNASEAKDAMKVVSLCTIFVSKQAMKNLIEFKLADSDNFDSYGTMITLLSISRGVL